MKLRDYIKEDSPIIATWLRSEEELYKWSSDRFNKFPLEENDIEENYAPQLEAGRFFPLTAEDEEGNVIGHFIIRYPREDDDSSVRFGFVIVAPEFRGKGYGKALLKKLAQITVERGCGRLEWSCLDWNKPSTEFYRDLGAIPMNEWTTYRVTGDTLVHMAE